MERPGMVLLASASVMGACYALQQLIKTIYRCRHPASLPCAGAVALWAPPPHPGWTPPAPQPPPFPGTATIDLDPAALPPDRLYALMISAVVPRPVAFVSTLGAGAGGAGNLAPYSYFGLLMHNPPTLAVGIVRSRERSHGRKDTLVNILETGEFVVNLISEWFVEAANHCCGNFEYGQDEMALSGLTPLPSAKVRPPRVRESAVQLECQLRHTYETKDSKGAVTGTIVLGEVVMIHIQEGVAGQSPTGKLVVDINRLRPISRMGGNTYGRTAGLFDLPRPDRTA